MIWQGREFSQRNGSSFTPVTGNVLQRKCSCNKSGREEECEACAKKKPAALQRKPGNGPAISKIPSLVKDVLHAPGRELDPDTRFSMGSHFNHDFSKVRVHTDAKAAESARAVNALAYTVGEKVVFNTGQYNPGNREGQQLLAHELTHVVQQSGTAIQEDNLRIGQPDDSFEQEAANQAGQVKTGESKGGDQASPAQLTGAAFVQRQPAGPSGVPSLVAPLHLPAESSTIGEDESITVKNPKLVTLAASYKQMAAEKPGAYIKLSTYLSESSKMNSAQAAKERTQLQRRMVAVQSALIELSVPADKIQIEPATTFARTGAGQISANLYESPRQLPSLSLPTPSLGLGPVAPPSPGAASPSLSELLSFRFNAGPLQFAVEIPKSAAIKLPVAISAAKTLSFALKAESSGDFSFTIALNGSRHLQVAAKAALKVDKDKGTSGSAGLEITTTKTVCSAPSPESLKAKITASGEKLTKAMKELETVIPDERHSKLLDIAGAIGEMYDAVDKSKSACKEVPRATINLGVQGPIAPSDAALNDPDPSKRSGSYIGGSVTFPF
jgi:hypothetical protein